MSLENVTTLAGQVNTDPVRHSCRMDKSPLIFDPLGNGSPILHIDNQKVSQLKESQEVEMKWGLGRGCLALYQHVTYWYTTYYSCKAKTDKCQEGRK